MSCDRQLLSEYHDGELSPEVRRQVETHVNTCAECQAILRQYQRLGLALRGLAHTPAPATLPARFHARAQAEPRTLTSRLVGLLSERGQRRPLALGALGTLAAAFVVAFALSLLPIRPQERLAVVAAYPPDGASDVVLDEPIEVVFNEPVDPSAVELAVRFEPAVPVESTVDGRKLIVRPVEPLQPDTKYVVVIEPRKPAPVASQVPAPVPAPTVTLSFSTGRTIAAAPMATQQPAVAAAPKAPPPAPASPTRAIAAAPPPTQTPPSAVAAARPSATVPPTQAMGIAGVGATPTGQLPCVAEPGQATTRELRQRPDVAQKLGCALTPERSLAVVEQSFEGGAMLWLSDRREIAVLFATGRWSSFPDTYQPAPSPSPTGTVLARPTGSLGKLWQDRLDVRGPLGKPTAAEVSRLARVQSFARGLAISPDASSIYVLYDDGTWQRLSVGGTPLPTATATVTPTPGQIAPTATPTAPAATATPAPHPLTTTPTATATPTVTPTSAATATPTITPTSAATASPIATPETPTPTATPTHPTAESPSPTATPSPTLASSPTPGEGPPPTATASPTATPTVTPTPAESPPPTPTASPQIAPTPTPTATLASGSSASATTASQLAARIQELSPCEVAVVHSFGQLEAANSGVGRRVGCAIASEQTVQAAEQQFEGGYVYWRADVRQVYVLYGNSTWAIFADTWQEGDPEKAVEAPPSGRLAPVRSIGRVWRESQGVRTQLGWAVAPERTFSGVAQPFERGLMLWSSARRTYVLYADGTWQEFRDDSGEPGS